MKVVERIFKHRIQQQIDIDDLQFGFMKGKGTSNAIFIVRQMQGKFRTKGKKLYFAFVDLEKAFDRVLREVIRCVLCCSQQIIDPLVTSATHTLLDF